MSPSRRTTNLIFIFLIFLLESARAPAVVIMCVRVGLSGNGVRECTGAGVCACVQYACMCTGLQACMCERHTAIRCSLGFGQPVRRHVEYEQSRVAAVTAASVIVFVPDFMRTFVRAR